MGDPLAAFSVLAVMLAAIASVVIVYLRTGVAPHPTARAVRRRMLQSAPDDVNGPVYDLGSGWGGLAFALAHRYPDCTVIGVELSPLPWAVSRLRLLLQPTPNLHLRYGEFYNVPLGDAALVVCFLEPEAMPRLQRKLMAELPPSAWVVSAFFRMPNWQPQREERVADRHATTIYHYRIGDQMCGSAYGIAP